MCDQPPAASYRRRRGFRAVRPMGRTPARIDAQPARDCPVAARPSAMQCVDTAFTGLRQAAVNVRQLVLGLALATTSRAETAVPPSATWMLKRHSALVRVIAAGPAAQRLCPARQNET
jgi:hypothetical protein